MNSRRIFYVIYFEDSFVQSCLDLIRYLSEWSERTPAHVTVRGPYQRKLSKKMVQKLNSHIEGKPIDVQGVSAFLNENQNTVYLRCMAQEIKDLWYKPNYPFNPHLTLYDGNDRSFADDLLAGLSSQAQPFKIKALGVDEIISIKGERALPTTRLNLEEARKDLGIDLSSDASMQYNREVRLNQICHIFNALQAYSCKLEQSQDSNNISTDLLSPIVSSDYKSRQKYSHSI